MDPWLLNSPKSPPTRTIRHEFVDKFRFESEKRAFSASGKPQWTMHFEDGYFDLILSSQNIEHIHNTRLYLEECYAASNRMVSSSSWRESGFMVNIGALFSDGSPFLRQISTAGASEILSSGIRMSPATKHSWPRGRIPCEWNCGACSCAYLQRFERTPRKGRFKDVQIFSKVISRSGVSFRTSSALLTNGTGIFLPRLVISETIM